MSIGPLLPGRLPGSLAGRRLQQNIEHSNFLLGQLQEQAATGQKFFLPSDAPASAVRTIFLQKQLERNQQLQANVVTDRSLLSASEQAMGSVADALNRAKSFIIAGVGDSTSSEEKQAMATETASLIKGVVNTANTRFNGRYLFGGSESQTPPFEIVGGGLVRYNGDKHRIDSYIDSKFLLANNLDGDAAFNAITTPITRDVDPALTLETKIADLLGGEGIELDEIVVTLDDGTPQTATVDLSQADTVQDLKTLLEDAFAGGPLTLTVDIDPGSNNGLRLTPSAGTVQVTDLQGSHVAADLGIASGPVAVVNGGDLDPALTLRTALSAFNNGAGIGATAGNGLDIVNGLKSATVDISAATTVEELFNTLETADLDLYLDINEDRDGLAISSRISGGDFAIGENNGNNAELLGIRTFGAGTLLSDLNYGLGVPVDGPDDLEITRRDGSALSIDLGGTKTVQDVLDAINATGLVATLNAVGNGVSITDGSGTGPLVVKESPLSQALGIDGAETGTDPLVPLVGRDPNPQQTNGVLTILVKLEAALRLRDDRAMESLDQIANDEIARTNLVRAEVGGRLKVIDQVEQRLFDDELHISQGISEQFDADIAEVVTQVAAVQSALQATLQIAGQTLSLSLLNFL